MSKKLFAAISAVMLLLCSCGKPVVSDSVDYGYVEGYYSELGYEVKTEEGVITEQLYFLCSDPELSNTVGHKSVYFDEETGEMNKYVIYIGIVDPEKIVNYSTSDDGTYYSEMYFNEGNILERMSWDNEYSEAEGGTVREVGSEEYYDDGVTRKKSEYKRYQNDELIESDLKEYDRDGNLTKDE